MIEQQDVKMIFPGNGENTTFAFNLPFQAPENIHCFIIDENNNETELSDSDFSVEVRASYDRGATVTLTEPPADGTSLVIIRQIKVTQQLDLIKFGRLPSEELEAALDKLTMICQQFQERFSRALILPVNSKEDPKEYISKLMRIAEDAIAAANSAIDSADRALQAVASLDQKIAAAENAIGTYTDNATSQAQERIAESQTAAENSIAALTEEKKTELAGIVSDANDAANSAAGSAQAALASANAADRSAAGAANFAALATGSASDAASSADRAAAAAETAAGEVAAAKNELAAELKDYVDNSITNGEW